MSTTTAADTPLHTLTIPGTPGGGAWCDAVEVAGRASLAAGTIGRFTARRPPARGPLVVEMTFTLPRPASAPRRRTHPDRRPALTGLAAQAAAALTSAGLWEREGQVIEQRTRKLYVGDPGALDEPGTVIRVWAAGDAPDTSAQSLLEAVRRRSAPARPATARRARSPRRPRAVPLGGPPAHTKAIKNESGEVEGWEILLPPLRLINANQQRGHSIRFAGPGRAIREAAALLARKIPPMSRAQVFGVYFPPDRRRRDPSNWAPSFKAALDGVVVAGVLPDDDHRHVVGPDARLGDTLMPGGRIALRLYPLPAE